MLSRFALCLLLVSLLSACSSMPERYAPWRDEGDTGAGHKPNLGDVPAAPDTAAAKAQMDTMRQRLEQDRDNAYLAAQGIVPVNDQAPVSSPANIQSTDLAPPANPLMTTNMRPARVGQAPIPPTTPVAPSPVSSITSAPLGMPNEDQPSVMTNSNVLYNYDPNVGNEYTYGTTGKTNSISSSASYAAIESDPSISVDWSALGDTSPVATGGVQLAGNGVTLGEPVAYFAHGSATLGPKDRAAIRNLATQLKRHPQPVMVAGNSSKRTGIRNTATSREVNLRMAAKRADAVMDELVKLGVSPELIYLSAYGDSIPNRRRGGDEAADRRVEIIFDK